MPNLKTRSKSHRPPSKKHRLLKSVVVTSDDQVDGSVNGREEGPADEDNVKDGDDNDECARVRQEVADTDITVSALLVSLFA